VRKGHPHSVEAFKSPTGAEDRRKAHEFCRRLSAFLEAVNGKHAPRIFRLLEAGDNGASYDCAFRRGGDIMKITIEIDCTPIGMEGFDVWNTEILTSLRPAAMIEPRGVGGGP
jgi:hypothetical protein